VENLKAFDCRLRLRYGCKSKGIVGLFCVDSDHSIQPCRQSVPCRKSPISVIFWASIGGGILCHSSQNKLSDQLLSAFSICRYRLELLHFISAKTLVLLASCHRFFFMIISIAVAAATNPKVAVTATTEPYPKLQSNDKPATPGF